MKQMKMFNTYTRTHTINMQNIYLIDTVINVYTVVGLQEVWTIIAETMPSKALERIK